VSRRARRARQLGGLVAVALLLAGSVSGQDDHFPFGPFRMFSLATPTDGRIETVALEGTTRRGRQIFLPFESVGLRTAEAQQQVRLYFVDDLDELLGRFAEAYRTFDGRNPSLRKLRLVYRVSQLRGGRPVAEELEVLGEVPLDQTATPPVSKQ
jgi:hypothetical protein